MNFIIRKICSIIIVITVSFSVHYFIIYPYINHWGATEPEIKMTMAGDQYFDHTVSTRAIDIAMPIEDTWLWLNQLGADRSGFFSYYFIEKAMGYVTQNSDYVLANAPQLMIGDLVRGSINPEKSMIPYNFKTIAIKANDYLVLENWGTFLVKSIDKQNTRLIIRTNGINQTQLTKKFMDYIGFSLHFVMERATLEGIKQRAETGAGVAFSDLFEKIWFLTIVVAGLLVAISIFTFDTLRLIAIPIFLSLYWSVTLFVLPPTPLYSTFLLITIGMIGG